MAQALATVGHNNPPSDLDELKDEFGLLEVENWLDGSEVVNDDQMAAVDDLIRMVKDAEKKAKAQKEAEFRPHKEAADAVSARWKPAFDDLKRMREGLLSVVGEYKAKRAAEQEAKRKAAEAEAARLKAEAEAVQRDVDMKDINQRREADEVSLEARQASREAARIESVKGLRTFTIAEIVDPKACINWLAQNDREAVLAFMQKYVDQKTREGVRGIGGVVVRQQKRAV